MKYIILFCFMLLSITCAAQATATNPIGTFYLPADTNWLNQPDTVIHWYDGSSTLSNPFNIYDSIFEIQKQVLEKLEIIQKQIEVIKRLDSLLNTDHSASNSEALQFIESVKTDSSLYRKQK